jgi:hypothetical protein
MHVSKGTCAFYYLTLVDLPITPYVYAVDMSQIHNDMTAVKPSGKAVTPYIS